MRGGLPADERARQSAARLEFEVVFGLLAAVERLAPNCRVICLGQSSSPVKGLEAPRLYSERALFPGAKRAVCGPIYPETVEIGENQGNGNFLYPLVGLYGRAQGTSVVLGSLLARPG